MLYFLIDPENSTIISGPHAQDSPELRKITRCGNPELINLLDYGLVPEVYPTITSTQKYGARIVSTSQVYYEVIEKTQEELAAEESNRLNNLRSTLICTPRQIRMVLAQQNLLSQVESYISTMDEITKIEWNYAQEIKRTHPAIISLSSLLGLSETQTDDLFTLAQTL